MKLKNILTIIMVFVLCSLGLARPRVIIGDNPFPFPDPKPNILVLKYTMLNSNNISAFFYNSGIFDQDLTTNNKAGFEWPKGSGKTAIFTAGLCIGCYITKPNGISKLAEVMASYKGEYVPGAVKREGGIAKWDNDPMFKQYVVRLGDNAGNNPDYDNWYLMIPYGAPYTDVNNNGVWDRGIDVPGQKSAGETIFQVLTDADPTNRTSGEGFGGGIQDPLLYAEIHFTAWAYNTPGLEDLQFVNWIVINKGDSAWRKTYLGVVVDPDLGNSNDDYIGCDTVNKINLGYVYNGDNNDEGSTGIEYGLSPPASGMDYFKSPIIKRPGLPNDTLGMTSFTFFTNNGSSPPPCESDPNGEPVPAYYNLQGLKKDRSPWLDPTFTPPVPTKYCYTGDPETNQGWTESKGSVQNCGGTTGTILTVNPKGDRRFIFSSGRDDFSFNPGDTQNIVLAQFVARGSNNLNSVTKLKSLAKTAKTIYLANFNVTPPPPSPVATPSYTPLTNGLCNIVLSWDDAAEKYKYWDTIFYQKSDSNIYEFQGYEVYEINKYANSLPDFTKPETIDLNAIQIVDCFDKIDNVGPLVDTFSTGLTINNNEQFAPYPIVPPYKMPSPPSFPNKGISRGITLTGTKFSANYGGQTSFIYGQEYQFAIVAYAVSKSTHIKRGFKVIRNSISAQIIKIRPTTPPIGTTFTMKNGDTLNTTRRDLSLMPIIRNQDFLKNATYRVVFNPMTDIFDTSYNILRKLQGQTNFDTIKTKLKFANSVSLADDSSRTIDGILFKMTKIKYKSTQGVTIQYDGKTNVGLVKDPISNRDSLQTRQKGWEYKPESHTFVKGSYFKYSTDWTWQSLTMSASYPSNYTYNNTSSGLPLGKLRTVKIVFSNTNKQYAYRYLDTVNSTEYKYQLYQGMTEVPFRVYETDYTDSTQTDRPLNCGFIQSKEGDPNNIGIWKPNADSLGGKLLLVIFNTNYDTSLYDYKYDLSGNPTNIFFTGGYPGQVKPFDIMYIWAPRLTQPGATFVNNDELWFYPYTTSIPYIQGNLPLYWDFTTIAPVYGDVTKASTNNELEKIRVVPNPYFGYSTLDRSTSDRFVTFRNLPLQCTIKIYTLNGDLINTINKTNTGNPTFNSTIEWNLQNMERTPVASGIYVAFIDAPGIGTKIVKIVVFTSQERINF